MIGDPVQDAPPGAEALKRPEFTAYRLHDSAPELVPAAAARLWMDATNQRFAYRCTPLSIANASGWELLSPVDFDLSWTGGRRQEDLRVTPAHPADSALLASFAQSHFGEGIVTFHPGYLFRTSPGWALWVRGSPNQPAINLHPLEGIVETDWLPYTFTMNWRFSAPGSVRFRKGDRFCFLTLVPHALLGQVQPVVRRLEDDPELAAAHHAWSTDRQAFTERLRARDPETVQQGWQRYYLRGEGPAGQAGEFHLAKQRMKAPITES